MSGAQPETADLLEVMLLRIRQDPELLLDLDYCVPLGIPHSEFAGACRADGQPRWTDQDRLKAIAYREHVARRDADLCPTCCTRRREWDPDQGGHPYAYVPDLDGCRGCELAESLQKEVQGKPELASRGGVRIVLVRNPNPIPMDEVTGG